MRGTGIEPVPIGHFDMFSIRDIMETNYTNHYTNRAFQYNTLLLEAF